MAKKRMFSLQIVDTDAFLEMPLSTQALYFHLSMRADDDGFVDNPKKITKAIGANEDDLKILLGKRFVLGFESGIIVIKHWRMNNYIRSDRYEKTVYLEEKNQLTLKENGAYTEKIKAGIPNDNQMDTQYRLDKNRLDKVSIDVATPSAADHENIVKVFSAFKEINPTINYGNKTNRRAASELIKKFGLEKTLNTAKYAVSIQGQKYAPTITTPNQLKDKLGELLVFHKKENAKQPIII